MAQERSLENYEPVKVRKKRFYSDYNDGRIIVELLENTKDHSVLKASCFKNKEEQLANSPLSTGFAQEFKGQGGFANKTSWLENGEESAVGRCLDNAGYATNDKCSREEMIAANRNEGVFLKELQDLVAESFIRASNCSSPETIVKMKSAIQKAGVNVPALKAIKNRLISIAENQGE